MAELEAALAGSEADWKLVVGHHPVLSSGGAHGDQLELQQHVQPVLEKYGVQARATPKNRAAAACQRFCYPHLCTIIASLRRPKSWRADSPKNRNAIYRGYLCVPANLGATCHSHLKDVRS